MIYLYTLYIYSSGSGLLNVKYQIYTSKLFNDPLVLLRSRLTFCWKLIDSYSKYVKPSHCQFIGRSLSFCGLILIYFFLDDPVDKEGSNWYILGLSSYLLKGDKLVTSPRTLLFQKPEDSQRQPYPGHYCVIHHRWELNTGSAM